MNDLGEKLHQLRTDRQLNLRQLAEMSGVSAGTLCGIEKGRTNPSVSVLYAVASALSVPISYFFDRNDLREDAVWSGLNERLAENRANRSVDEAPGQPSLSRASPRGA